MLGAPRQSSAGLAAPLRKRFLDGRLLFAPDVAQIAAHRQGVEVLDRQGQHQLDPAPEGHGHFDERLGSEVRIAAHR